MSGKLLPGECAPSVRVSTSSYAARGAGPPTKVAIELGRDGSYTRVGLTPASARDVARALMEAANEVEPEVAS